MIDWEGFTEMTDEELVDAECHVRIEGEWRQFKHFVVVGIDVDESDMDEDGDLPELISITCIDIRDLYRAIEALQRVYEHGMSQLPEEVRRQFEVDIYTDKLLEGESN